MAGGLLAGVVLPRSTGGTVPAGLAAVKSQAWKKVPRSWPESSSARRMKSALDTLPPAWVSVHSRRMSKNTSSPTRVRRACSVIAPRTYTAKSKSAAVPGSPIFTVQNGAWAGMAAA